MDHDVRIYNAPKTVIDCFRWQHASVFDVALEAAREYLEADCILIADSIEKQLTEK